MGMKYGSEMNGEGYEKGCANGTVTVATLRLIATQTQEDDKMKMIHTSSSTGERRELRLGVLVHSHESTGAE